MEYWLRKNWGIEGQGARNIFCKIASRPSMARSQTVSLPIGRFAKKHLRSPFLNIFVAISCIEAMPMLNKSGLKSDLLVEGCD